MKAKNLPLAVGVLGAMGVAYALYRVAQATAPPLRLDWNRGDILYSSLEGWGLELTVIHMAIDEQGVQRFWYQLGHWPEVIGPCADQTAEYLKSQGVIKIDYVSLPAEVVC